MAEQTQITLHTKSISRLVFNPQANLFFSASKEPTIGCFDLNGHLLGTYDGLRGAVWGISASHNSLISGSADGNVTHWDLYTGKIISQFPTETTTKATKFFDENIVLTTTDDSFRKKPQFIKYDLRTNEKESFFVEVTPSSILNFQNNIVFSDVIGNLCKFDIRSFGKILSKTKIHFDKINELSSSPCGTFFISSSLDCSSKVIDYDFNVIKTFTPEDPCNTSAISRNNDKIFLGVGIPARDVTTSSGKGRFDIIIYDVISEEQVGAYTQHFAPVNALILHPSDTFFISGGEDGIIWKIDFQEDIEGVEMTCF
ncbi:Eukaryotic translation initiation factor 3 subunit I [Cucumispora dikerogammari]|nr:Eukaryotic translation initiation factor 3 subunit I [Cucumispora dikerogammari]